MRMMILLTSALTLFLGRVSAGQGRPQSPHTNGHSMTGPSQGLVVSTSAGLVQGSKKILTDGLSVKTWVGIPYAEPPVGALRFEVARKKESWSGVREALKSPSSCPQTSPFSMTGGPNITSTDEDCLYLNIYAPGVSESLLPVMIWIHPGGFNFGSLEDTDPSVMAATRNVIVVTLQYRLGALGFSLFNKNVSNLGLRDQIVAIDFVSHNIINFGGDPTRVTVFGSEAGAVSASYHNHNIHLSSLLHGLILQSAGPANSWAKLDSKETKQRTAALAERLGCSPADTACLQALEVEDILQVQDTVCGHGLVTANCFVPTVDDEIVFSNKYQEKLNKTNTAVMFGYNSNEGFLRLMQFLTKEFPTEKLYSDGFSEEMYRRMLSRMFPEVDNQIISVIDFLYQDIEGPTKASVRFLTLERIVSDFLFTCSNSHLQYEKAYRYLFSWQPSTDLWPEWSGVKQGDEEQFVFGSLTSPSHQYLPEETEFSDRLMDLWAEFAYNGSFANSSWPQYEGRNILELHPTRAGLRAVTEVERQRCQFWTGLYPELREAGRRSDCADQQGGETQSLNKKSTLVVDEPQPRTVRGLNTKHFSQRPQQFVYKVKTKLPKEKKVGSTVKVLKRENLRPNKVYKRQTKPENNTQLSYQLSVSNPEEAFTVYNTKLSGNSPIYIAPLRYQPQPVQYRPPTTVRNVATSFGENTYSKLPPQKSVSSPDLNTNYVDSAYDPFFPGFGAKLAVERERTPVVGLSKDVRSHNSDTAFPYFPNK